MFIRLGKRYINLNRVREIRRKLDITQQELADKLKSTRSYISWLESGQNNNPSLARARTIAKALNSTVDKVFP